MNNNEQLDNLLKTADQKQAPRHRNQKVSYSKRKLNSICRALSYDTKTFQAAKAIDSINSYVNAADHLPRILYSEITNYVYSLDVETRGQFATNIDTVLYYALAPNNNIDSDTQEAVIRIYDHCQLAFYQADNVQSSFASGIEDTKSVLEDQFKGIEKEYISILGIFASIILAFVGGLTFSTSVLTNIDKASIYRQVIISCIIGIVFFDLIWVMIDLIRSINGREIRRKWIAIAYNIIMIGGIFFTAFAFKFKWFG